MMLLKSLPQNAADSETTWFMTHLVFSPFLSIHILFVFFIKVNHLGKSFHLNIFKSALKRRFAKCCEISFEGYSNLCENLHMDMRMEEKLRKELKF